MPLSLDDLIQHLDLEMLEVNLFRGQSRDLGGRSVFGGQVIGQALVAASRTVAGGAVPHSLHAYFLRRGDMAKPIVYEVDRIRDGSHFTTRRVQAIQHGAPILSMIASFQLPETGLEHAFTMPDVPPPEACQPVFAEDEKWLDPRHTLNDAMGDTPPGKSSPQSGAPITKLLEREQSLEYRFVTPLQAETGALQQHLWLRAAAPLPDDPIMHQCVLTYASDFNLLATAFQPHGLSIFRDDTVIASIDHALWFHRPFRIDDWLLYTMDSPSAQSARGFARGMLFDRSGRLVASVAQEGLMRVIDPAQRKAHR